MALTRCKDCGKDLSTDAEKCPHCGARAQSISVAGKNSAIGCVGLIVIVILIAMFFGSSDKTTAPVAGTDKVIADLRGKQAVCRQNLQELESMGAVRISDSPGVTEAAFDEGTWNALEHDDKIKQALLIFCAKMPPDGHYQVMIRGLHDGKSMGNVVDGNYFD
jgi:hypothetical protein